MQLSPPRFGGNVESEMEMQTQTTVTTTTGIMREMLALALRALLSGAAVALLAGLLVVGLTIAAG